MLTGPSRVVQYASRCCSSDDEHRASRSAECLSVECLQERSAASGLDAGQGDSTRAVKHTAEPDTEQAWSWLLVRTEELKGSVMAAEPARPPTLSMSDSYAGAMVPIRGL